MDPSDIVIPSELRPADGRFGSGPSKIRPEAVAALAGPGATFLGTSHRKAPVRNVVRGIREGLTELFGLPDGYEVLLGLGGATLFWEAMAFCLVERKSQHLSFGEFSSRCAAAVGAAPHLSEPVVIEAPFGAHPEAVPDPDVDLYALTQNETSTGVMMPVRRPSPQGLTAVDATSAAGGLRVDPAEFDVYYFSPQKGFASDGGLWFALCSPAALERIERIGASDRYVPASLDLAIALRESRKDQTYNTPALATLFLMAEQLSWLLARGGLGWAAARCDRSAGILYDWADRNPLTMPFVSGTGARSHVVATIDLDASIDARAVTGALRANGIVDTEPYRKLGRNQLRVGMYPAVDPEDVERLTLSIDMVLDVLGT